MKRILMAFTLAALSGCTEQALPRGGENVADVGAVSVALSNLPSSVRCVEINSLRGTTQRRYVGA